MKKLREGLSRDKYGNVMLRVPRFTSGASTTSMLLIAKVIIFFTYFWHETSTGGTLKSRLGQTS